MASDASKAFSLAQAVHLRINGTLIAQRPEMLRVNVQHLIIELKGAVKFFLLFIGDGQIAASARWCMRQLTTPRQSAVCPCRLLHIEHDIHISGKIVGLE